MSVYYLKKEDGGYLLLENGGKIVLDTPNGVAIEVNDIDRSYAIDWQSVKKTEVLTKEPDTLEFLIKNYATKTFLPVLNDKVDLYYGDTLIFSGVVIEIDSSVEGLLKYNKIICKDYTHLADQKLVSKTYSATTVEAIVNDIVTTFCPAGFTVNVSAPTPIDAIVFNYVTVTQALRKLISVAGGGYDYYFDYNKCLQFFQTGYFISPFTITDTSQNYDWQSLSLNTDLSQLRNRITVRGGIASGTAVTNLQIADGAQRVFFIGYSMTDILIWKALSGTPTVFVAQTVGADGKDIPASFDCLYNPDSGLVIWPEASKPLVNDVIKYTGTPSFPVVVQIQNDYSINTYGAYEFLVTDKTITTKETARAKAQAILLQYSMPLTTGEFTTRTIGLKAGQVITMSSAIRNFSGSYKIEQIDTVLRTPSATTNDFIYKVKIVSTESLTMNDVLKKLLVTDPTDQIAIGSNEIVDTIYAEPETITCTDVVIVSSNIGNTETATVGESNTVQSLNYAVIFCVGQINPTGFQRQFCCDGSRLG